MYQSCLFQSEDICLILMFCFFLPISNVNKYMDCSFNLQTDGFFLFFFLFNCKFKESRFSVDIFPCISKKTHSHRCNVMESRIVPVCSLVLLQWFSIREFLKHNFFLLGKTKKKQPQIVLDQDPFTRADENYDVSSDLKMLQFES